jgi:hypothetical protein
MARKYPTLTHLLFNLGKTQPESINAPELFGAIPLSKGTLPVKG